MPLGSAQMGAGVREGGKKKGYIVVSKVCDEKPISLSRSLGRGNRSLYLIWSILRV
jgi:hypothetical protein